MFPVNYKSIVEKKYYQTAFLFEQMEISTFNQFEYETFLDAFINSLRNITFSMQKEWSIINWFKDWYSWVQEKLRQDKTLKFFSELRNFSIKEWNNWLWWESWLEMRHMVSFDWKWWQSISVMTRSWKIVDEVKIEDPNFNIMNPEYWYCEKMYFFDQFDWLELDNYTIKSVNNFAYDALFTMKDVVQDYLNKFINNDKN